MLVFQLGFEVRRVWIWESYPVTLLMTQIPHEFMLQDLRNCGRLAYFGCCRICILNNSTLCDPSKHGGFSNNFGHLMQTPYFESSGGAAYPPLIRLWAPRVVFVSLKKPHSHVLYFRCISMVKTTSIHLLLIIPLRQCFRTLFQQRAGGALHSPS